MYILLLEKYNTLIQYFLYDIRATALIFLYLAILSLLVFFATSTSVVSKPFQCPLLTALLPSKVFRVESPPPEALPLPPRPLPSSDLSLLAFD